MSPDWDATSYDALPLPHVAWGEGVLRRLRLRRDERVLDAGCGTGRDLVVYIARARTPLPKSTRDYIARCETYLATGGAPHGPAPLPA